MIKLEANRNKGKSVQKGYIYKICKGSKEAENG